MKTIEILGEKAEYYLSHVCRTIDKSQLYLPAPDTVDKVWIESDRNIRTLGSLQWILAHGRLAGTGYVSILPVDQGIEHSAGASFAPNPIYFDPENIVRLAIEGGCNAVASTFGVLGAVARRYAHKIPFIVKLNHNELLTYPNTYDQVMFGTVRDAWNMGAAAVGATIYFGSEESRRQLVEIAQAFDYAHELGMATILWCYLRNEGFRKDGVDYHASADLTGQANHLGVTIKADIVKQKLPSNNGGFRAVGFGKTGMIEPGASETLSMTVNKRDIASYDTYGAGTYVLDAGDYYFTAATDAHNAVNNILAAKGYTVESTNGKMTADGNADLTYTWTEDALDTTTYATSENGTAITNQLSCADPNLYEGIEETVTWLSRSDWNGTLPTETVKLALTELLKKDLKDIRYDPADYESVDMPTLGAKNGVKLYDMIGLDYNDPKWDELLDQMTFDEMNSLIGDAFHWTMPVKSVEAPGTRDENGPQGLTASLLGNDKSQLTATAFTSEDVMAATFNTEIMTEIGKVIGNNCLEADIACLYGPGNNIHRTPYGGRNFEYYSEDGFLSGMMSAYEVKAIQDKGVHVVMKHFALNDCEQDRIGLGVWINEQAAREVYLKAFQAPVEVGNANGVMIAYTRWGAVWSGGNYGLVTGILRNEWGCDGMVITDNVLTQYVNGPDGVLAGVSIYDAMMSFVTDTLPKYKNDPVIVTAMREACHHNLYAIANSCGMNGVGADTTIKVTRPTVVTMSIIIACASTFFCLLGIVMWIIGGIKFRKTEEYKAYKDFKKSLKAAKKA